MANSKTQAHTLNYFIKWCPDGAPILASCSPPLGYATFAAAKEAEIRELSERMRYQLEIIDGLLNVTEAKEPEDKRRLYCEINGFMNDIEEAKETEEKVKRLKL